jgi:hypothetical protein
MRNKLKSTKKDWVFISVISMIILSFFVYFQYLNEAHSSGIAYVYYSASDDPIATINFNRKEVVVHYTQDDTGESVFPLVDLDQQTITILGDYEVDGIRQVVVIGYNFNDNSVRIVEEESPYHVCSRQGETTQYALICLPNGVRVEFSYSEEDFVI